jgi:hypothetical protein
MTNIYVEARPKGRRDGLSQEQRCGGSRGSGFELRVFRLRALSSTTRASITTGPTSIAMRATSVVLPAPRLRSRLLNYKVLSGPPLESRY